MSDWQVVWLGVIAVSVALMAAIQIALIAALAFLTMQAAKGVRELRNEIKPLMEKVTKVADDAGRVSGLAVAQAERIDELVKATAQRIEDTVGAVQSAVVEPLRQGTAFMAAIRAIIAAFKGRSDRRSSSRDDEDALFVG